jgi:cytidylate kinase
VTVRVVAIDGPAGSGKSTLAEALSERIGLPYVNTGSMYRALTAAALRAGVPVEDARGLVGVMSRLRFRVDRSLGRLVIEGPFDPDSLEGPEVEAAVSVAASHPEVRAMMRAEQRRLGEPGAVMEGRDIGSEVFPEAPVKVFLRAEPSTREARRARERLEPESDVAQALRVRDSKDSVVNPFEPQAGALVVDTTKTGAEETLRIVLEAVRNRLS